tara:strand:- start:956 stop:1921 length:966 start_codon:yes stop_codon:yes gene_type:complete
MNKKNKPAKKTKKAKPTKQIKKNKKKRTIKTRIQKKFRKGKTNFKKIKRSVTRKTKRLSKRIKKSLKKIKKKLKLSQTLKEKYNIKDIPLSRKINKGTKASSNVISYHYQDYKNISNFMTKEFQKEKIENVCFFKKNPDIHLQLDITQKVKVVKPLFISEQTFIDSVNQCYELTGKKKFIPIILNIVHPSYFHANILLIDTDLKRVELFEPHGYKSKDSTVEGISSAYYNKVKAVKHFFKKILPDFQFINTVDIINEPSFQANYDAHSGYCVTWSILYAHYRILNPNVPLEKLIEYMEAKVNTRYLLRYAAYIEEVLKNKI